MIDSLSPILELLIGVYTYGIFKSTDGLPYGGIGSLDYGYFARFFILLVSLIMVYKLLTLVIVRMFGRGNNVWFN